MKLELFDKGKKAWKRGRVCLCAKGSFKGGTVCVLASFLALSSLNTT